MESQDGRTLRCLHLAARDVRASRRMLYWLIREAYAQGLILESIAHATGISRTSVHRIVTGRKTHEGAL